MNTDNTEVKVESSVQSTKENTVKKPTKKTVKKSVKKATKKNVTKKSGKAVKKSVEKKSQKKAGGSPSKMELARQIMVEHKGEKRADILLLFVSRVGLTPKGAQTYYQLLKPKKK